MASNLFTQGKCDAIGYVIIDVKNGIYIHLPAILFKVFSEIPSLLTVIKNSIPCKTNKTL